MLLDQDQDLEADKYYTILYTVLLYIIYYDKCAGKIPT